MYETRIVSETGGNPWTAPYGWVTLLPQLNLNLDDLLDLVDPPPYAVYGGAMPVVIGVSMFSHSQVSPIPPDLNAIRIGQFLSNLIQEFVL